MRNTFLYWYLFRGFLKMNWTSKRKYFGRIGYLICLGFIIFMILNFYSLLWTIFKSVSVEAGFCSLSIMFFEKVYWMSCTFWIMSFIVVIDINFLIFCILCRKRRVRNYFHIFIYIFVQFGSRSCRNENEVFIML